MSFAIGATYGGADFHSDSREPAFPRHGDLRLQLEHRTARKRTCQEQASWCRRIMAMREGKRGGGEKRPTRALTAIRPAFSILVPPTCMLNETIAHYRILRKLGSGGMGVVYEAEDTKLGRRVALKFLPEDSHHDSQSRELFLREARAASSLNHSGICTIHAIEEHHAQTFIAMELLEGQTLDKLMRAGILPISRAVEIGIQLA